MHRAFLLRECPSPPHTGLRLVGGEGRCAVRAQASPTVTRKFAFTRGQCAGKIVRLAPLNISLKGGLQTAGYSAFFGKLLEACPEGERVKVTESAAEFCTHSLDLSMTGLRGNGSSCWGVEGEGHKCQCSAGAGGRACARGGARGRAESLLEPHSASGAGKECSDRGARQAAALSLLPRTARAGCCACLMLPATLLR